MGITLEVLVGKDKKGRPKIHLPNILFLTVDIMDLRKAHQQAMKATALLYIRYLPLPQYLICRAVLPL